MGRTYDYMEGLLPYELKRKGNAIKFKKLMAIYGSISDDGYIKSENYGNIMDIMSATHSGLDSIGNMFNVSRNLGESDDAYRDRILNTNIERKTPVTIPELQQAIDSIVTDGNLYVLENHNDKACNIYMTGTASEDSVIRALAIVQRFLPAGVGVVIPVVTLATWNSVKTQFNSWNSLKTSDYIW